MTATVRDLRAALDDQARSCDPDAAATLLSVQRRVAAGDRRRRGVAVTALVAVLAAGAAVVTGEGSRDETAPAGPGETRPLADHPSLPQSHRGMLRVSLTEWGLRPDDRISIPLPDLDGQRVYVAASCSATDGKPPVLFVQTRRALEFLRCVQYPAPADAPLWTSDDEVRLAGPGEVPSRLTVEARGRAASGTARVAVYVGTDAMPPRPPEDALSTFAHSYGGDLFEPAPGSPNSPLTVTGPAEQDLLVSLIARGPGRLRATVNGKPITFGCHSDPASLLLSDECRVDDSMAEVRTVDYGPLAEVFSTLGPPGEYPVGQRLTLTVVPEGFVGDDWRVAIFRWTERSGAYPPAGTWVQEK
jgi:hypothetical protein